MKTLKTAVAALLIAGGAIGAFAFTKADSSNENNKEAELYWFDASTGDYILTGESSGCDNTNLTPCAVGYPEEQIADPENPEKPSGSPTETATGVRN
jgi:hypothetical protein